MKSVGIICEYNPFHNGHLYHIKKIKEMYPEYVIVCVMNGNFTQRGDFSLTDKYEKTMVALNYVDLVIELPFVFGTQSADIFTKGSADILNALNGTFETNLTTDDITNLVKMQIDDMASWNINSVNVDGTGASLPTYSYPNQNLYVMNPNMETVTEAINRLNVILETPDE